MNKAIVFLGLICFPFFISAQTCVESTAYTELDINKVSAGVLAAGDLWWDLSNGKYIAPKPLPGEDPVSAIFAGAIWIGGYDNSNNLKVAAQSYRQGGNDFWPGPVITNPMTAIECLKWDQHFSVLGSEITAFLADYNDNGTINDPIPNSIITWPASGNPNAFPFLPPLPIRDLAPFKDQNGNGIYEPTSGDHPILGLDNSQDEYADQMIWWVVNDVGDTHGNTNGKQIGLEMQVMAYAYIDPPFDYTTFYTYDIINHSSEDLLSTYVGQWVDVDLGCWSNDFLGCDVSRSMGIGYNGTATDPDCFGASTPVAGYENDVPLLGVDLLAGPKDSAGNSLPMTSFLYYNGDGSPIGQPSSALHHYQFLRGIWKDGSPIEHGGTGYQQGTYSYPYMFPDDPTDPTGWSECADSNAPGDRRFVMGSGPFTFPAGGRNEFTIAVIFEPSVPHPCPSFAPLQATSDTIQSLFNRLAATNNEEIIPEILQQLNVYPNPTTASKGITVANVPAKAILEITSIDGRKLYTERQESVTGDVFWDLKTDQGRTVSQGLYLVSIRLEGVGHRVFKISVI